MNPISQVLIDAADHLDAYGWTQDEFHANEADPAHSAACAVGAIRVAARGDEDNEETAAEAIGCLADYVDPGRDDLPSRDVITEWNDCSYRRQAQVTEALRRAAKEWDEEES